jgi:tetratricopeptide (TPR) repeat protein
MSPLLTKRIFPFVLCASLSCTSHATAAPEPTWQELNSSAAALTLQGKADQAAKLYKRSLTLQQRALGADNPALIQTMIDLGSIYESQGNHPAAMVLYNRVFAINQKKFGPAAPQTAISLHRLARGHQDEGKMVVAEKEYKQLLSLLNAGKLSNSTDAVQSLRDYAGLLKQQDRKPEADEIESRAAKMENSIAELRPALPEPAAALQSTIQTTNAANQDPQINAASTVINLSEEDPNNQKDLANIYGTMANVYYKQSRYADAEPLYKRLIQIDEISLGANHPGLAGDLTNLALVYVSEKRYADAEPLIKRALQIYTSAYGSDNSLVAKSQALLASVQKNLRSE